MTKSEKGKLERKYKTGKNRRRNRGRRENEKDAVIETEYSDGL